MQRNSDSCGKYRRPHNVRQICAQISATLCRCTFIYVVYIFVYVVHIMRSQVCTYPLPIRFLLPHLNSSHKCRKTRIQPKTLSGSARLVEKYSRTRLWQHVARAWRYFPFVMGKLFKFLFAQTNPYAKYHITLIIRSAGDAPFCRSLAAYGVGLKSRRPTPQLV